MTTIVTDEWVDPLADVRARHLNGTFTFDDMERLFVTLDEAEAALWRIQTACRGVGTNLTTEETR